MIEREIKTYNQIMKARLACRLADDYSIDEDTLNYIYDFIQEPGCLVVGRKNSLLFYKDKQLVKTVPANPKDGIESATISSDANTYDVVPIWVPAESHSSGGSSGGSSYSGGSSNNNNNNNNG